MWQSSKFKGQHETLARMLAIGHQHDLFTNRRSQIFSSQHNNKTSATEAIHLLLFFTVYYQITCSLFLLRSQLQQLHSDKQYLYNITTESIKLIPDLIDPTPNVLKVSFSSFFFYASLLRHSMESIEYFSLEFRNQHQQLYVVCYIYNTSFCLK